MEKVRENLWNLNNFISKNLERSSKQKSKKKEVKKPKGKRLEYDDVDEKG